MFEPGSALASACKRPATFVVSPTACPKPAVGEADWISADRRPSEPRRSNRRSVAMPDREELVRRDDKRYIRRDSHGRFTSDQVDEGRSLTRDRRQHAETVVRKGQGDRGDQRRTSR
jgi:hypothetical protein